MISKPSANIFISAGESSGDMHAAELVKEIKKITGSKIQFYGLGGKKMEEAGVKLFYNLVDIAVVGLVEIIKNLPLFIKIFNNTVTRLKQTKPDIAVLIDNPGFNLRLAKKLKAIDIPVIYYISPQVWAWGTKRIFKMKKLIKKMLVVFKFEEDLYKKHGLECSFVGHPLLDIVKPEIDKESFKQKFNLKETNPLIGLLPGSRLKEIQNHLPTLIKTAKKIKEKYPQSAFIIIKPSQISKKTYEKLIGQHLPYIKIIENQVYDCINSCDFCITASGTATLETAILETPMIIIYKTSILTYLMLKPQVKVPFIGMVNLIAGRQIVPELIQNNFKPEILAKQTCSFLDNPQKLKKLKENLIKIKHTLGEKNASKKAAYEIINLMNFH